MIDGMTQKYWAITNDSGFIVLYHEQRDVSRIQNQPRRSAGLFKQQKKSTQSQHKTACEITE